MQEASKAFLDWWASEERVGELRENVPLSQATTLRLGGPAELFLDCASAEEIQKVLQKTSALRLHVTVLGAGSNVLVLDGGIPGLVLRVGKGLSKMHFDGETVTVEAGCSLAALSNACARRGLAGLTFACGIPGTVGGATIMNAGAYGGEMSDVVTQVDGYGCLGHPFSKTAEQLTFGYRYSALQEWACVVTSVTMKLTPGDPGALFEEMNDYKRQRLEKQPLDVPSAGSTFKRPKGAYAAALIESCGLKGYAVGKAEVSTKHAGFLVNRGDSAEDFLQLMVDVQRKVVEKTAYVLEPEIKILGKKAES